MLENSQCTELHHGDCVGADEQAHAIAADLGIDICIHPPDNNSLRANCNTGKHMITVPRPYIVRNQNIVNATDLLIAVVNGPEVRRSGTWATVRYARSIDRPIHIIYPDGSVVFEGGN